MTSTNRVVLHNDTLLTASYQNNLNLTTNHVIRNGDGQHTILVRYDPDTVSGTVKLNVRVQLSDNGTDWYTWRPFELSSGSYALGPESFDITSDESDLTLTIVIYADANYLRVGVKEEGGPGDFGNATVTTFSRPA